MIDIAQLDFSKLQLGKAGRNVKLLYDKEPLTFCTCTMYSPFGVKSIDRQWTTFPDFQVDCSMNQSQSESATSFRGFIDKLDTAIQELVKQQPSLFSGVDIATCDYLPILRQNKDYPPLMKLNVERDKHGNFLTFFFDKNKEKINVDETSILQVLKKRSMFKCIITCSRVWVYNGRIGTAWSISQVKLADNENNGKNDNSQEEKVSTQAKTMYDNIMIE